MARSLSGLDGDRAGLTAEAGVFKPREVSTYQGEGLVRGTLLVCPNRPYQPLRGSRSARMRWRWTGCGSDCAPQDPRQLLFQPVHDPRGKLPAGGGISNRRADYGRRSMVWGGRLHLLDFGISEAFNFRMTPSKAGRLSHESAHLILHFAGACFIVVCGGCGPNKSDFVGEWLTRDKAQKIELFGDGKGRVTPGEKSESQTLTWSMLPDNRAKLEITGIIPHTTLATIDGGVMRIDDRIVGLTEGIAKNTSFIKSENFGRGKWIVWHENGVKRMEVGIRDGKANGPAKVWDENGDLSEASEFKDDVMHGPVRRFFPSGKLKMEYENRDGKSEGPVKTYYESGELLSASAFQGDVLHGGEMVYFKSGKIWMENSWKHGVREGRSVSYFCNGIIARNSTYRAGREEDIQGYWSDGRPFYSGFENDRGHVFTVNFPSGEGALEMLVDFKENRLVGIEAVSDRFLRTVAPGIIVYSVAYPDGTMFFRLKIDSSTSALRELEYFHPDGKRFSFTEYVDGKLVKLVFLDKDGNPLSE